MTRILFALLFLIGTVAQAEEVVKVGTFDIDASPPIGTPMAYDPTNGIQDPLHCKGIVFDVPDGPIVIVAIDWIGVGGGGQTAFKEAIAASVGTSVERIAIHALHQHDAPTCNFGTAETLIDYGIDPKEAYFDTDFARNVIKRAAEAASIAKAEAVPVTQIGVGNGLVKQVASTRRILGEDGKVRVVRYTACRDPEIRAEPAGTIDPMVKLIALFHEDQPVVALTYYACHPQSYYRTGLASCDFPGLARNKREAETGVRHLHFDGAGGNIGAGKWNDGSPANRAVLADHVAEGMSIAWEEAMVSRTPLTPTDLGWNLIPVALPPAHHLTLDALESTLRDESRAITERITAARKLTWLRRCLDGDTIPVTCLSLGQARVLHLPGELFVEYQLAAQAFRPDLFVAMAAYGDYAPGYICTAHSYYQGGYEPSERASNVSPLVEARLLDAIARLLQD